MTYEQDRRLNGWLACYKVNETGSAADKALIGRIMDEAALTPQEPARLRPRVRGWAAEASLWVAAGVFGFWVGNGSIGTAVSAQTVASADVVDFDQMLFGSTSWSEVDL